MPKTQWPSEIAAILKDPGVIQLQVEALPLGCPNCGGAGVLAVYQVKYGPYRSCPDRGKWLDLPNGKSGWYVGKMIVGNCPVCRGGQMQQYLERNCGLTGADLNLSLSGFSTEGPYQGKERAKQICGELLGLNHLPFGFVTFWGVYGTGKTHLLKALVNGFRRVNVTAHYALLSDLLAEIRERFGDDNGMISTEAVLDEYQHIRVLCLDEINGANLTSWALETINRLLDNRYTHRNELLTVMAMNVAPAELPIELQYLASRMREGIVMEVGGVDVREVKSVQLKDWTV